MAERRAADALMLVKCICTNCAGHLEFEEENAGETIACPHCGFETVLTLPGTKPPDPELLARIRRRAWRRRGLFGGAALMVIAGFGYALYRWGVPWLEGLIPSIDTAGKAITVLLLGCALVPFAVAWLILPVVLFFQVRKGIELLSQIAGALETRESVAVLEPRESVSSEVGEEQATPDREAVPHQASADG